MGSTVRAERKPETMTAQCSVKSENAPLDELESMSQIKKWIQGAAGAGVSRSITQQHIILGKLACGADILH